MMEEFYNQIDDYLDGLLPESERTDFESALARDPALAQELAVMKEARERLSFLWKHEKEEADLRTTLHEIGAKAFDSTENVLTASKPKAKVRPFWWAVAASIAAAAIWFLWPSGKPELYAQYRHFPEASFATRGAGNDHSLETASNAFNKGAYREALQALQVHLKTSPDDSEAIFYSGLCQLELRQFKESETTLSSIRNTSWGDEAAWYLALVYLQQKDTNRYKTQLQQIPPTSPHYADAQSLLTVDGGK
jgi:anti-sigma-K factor RskA